MRNDDKKQIAPGNVSPGRRRLYPVALATLCIAVVLLAYALSVVVRGLHVYGELRKPPEPMQSSGRYVGPAFTVAPALGPVLTPGADGAWLIYGGTPVPFHHDDAGLRAPAGVRQSVTGRRHPRLLFLGDSLTYGALVAAEDAFAHKAAQALRGEAINAGVPGYGLAQMVLQARTLIARYRPDYVVVQYSPWLATRSQSEFATHSEDMIMAPYFSHGAGSLVVSPAAFIPPPALVARLDHYKTSPGGLRDTLSFLGRVAFPFFLDRDGKLLVFRLQQLLRLQPRPTGDTDEIVRSAYAEIDALAQANGARTVILALGVAKPLSVPGELFPAGVAGVNAWRAMVNRLPAQTWGNYIRHYCLWRGTPAQPVDCHPNEEAHALIAKVLAERIRMLEQRGN